MKLQSGRPAEVQQGTRRGVAAATVTFAATILLFIAGLALLVAAGFLTPPFAIFFIVEMAFPAVGFFIVHRTTNRVGWIFLIAGLGLGIQIFAFGYGEYALVHRPGTLPAATVVAWLGEIVWLPQLILATMFLFLLFPDGRLPSPRWRWVAGLGVAGTLLTEASVAFAPTLYNHPELRAPLAGVVPAGVGEVLGTVGGLVLLPAMLLALGSIVVRFRRADAVGRRQIKWFAYAAFVFFIAQMAFNVFELGADNPFLEVLSGLSVLVVPGAVAVAILRYRLYDIDVVVNRTLVYGSLTAMLAGVYVIGVVAAGGVIRLVTNDANDNVAIVASTLAVAGLFRPLRERAQRFIDRRFYRTKYDAARTLENFSARLRDEVDLKTLRADVLTVISDTVQPAHASIWMR